MRNYESYSSSEISDLNNQADKVISNPEEFEQEYIDQLISKVIELGNSFHQHEHGYNVVGIYSLRKKDSRP